LAEIREEKERVTFGLDQTLRKLQVELQDLNQSNRVEMEAVQKDMNEAVNKATADHELRMKQLQDQVSALIPQSFSTHSMDHINNAWDNHKNIIEQ